MCHDSALLSEPSESATCVCGFFDQYQKAGKDSSSESLDVVNTRARCKSPTLPHCGEAVATRPTPCHERGGKRTTRPSASGAIGLSLRNNQVRFCLARARDVRQRNRSVNLAKNAATQKTTRTSHTRRGSAR